jgi:hypothetical protein
MHPRGWLPRMSLFPDFGPTARAPETYEEFWASLPRDPKYEYYRGHQIKVLDAYERIDAKKRDVAVTLPTGTGKTIVALSLAAFSQRRQRKRALYLCPTKQLAAQVIDEARGLGVPAVDLTGAWDDVAQTAKDQYAAGESVGVASYWTLFNANPKTGTPELVIFDDVHAATDAALNPWLLSITRKEHEEVFNAVLDAIKEQAQHAIVSAGNPGPENRVTLIKHRHWLMAIDSIRAILNERAEESDLKWAWRRLRDRLPTCFCFLTPGTITIRPWVPPTFELPAFNNAKRRVYLTATLDRWGHLEHVMGIPEAERIPVPSVPVPGRRLILNLDGLLGNMEELDRVVAMARETPRALVLCRSVSDRDDVIERLKRQKYDGDILGAADSGGASPVGLDAEVESFRKSMHAILVLANRYDGLDLGNGLCTNLILYKLPLAIGPQEEFLTNVWGLQQAAEARARQRVQQGLGRCTRRENDSVIVGLVGADLLQFIQRPDVQRSLPPRLRAEFEFSRKIKDASKIDDMVKAVVTRDAQWTAICQSIDNQAGAYTDDPNPADDEIAKVHRKEAGWNMLYWTGDFPGASRTAAAAAQDLVKAGDIAGAAAWFYLASAAEDTHFFVERGTPYSDAGARFLHEANTRAQGRPWFAQLASLTTPPQVQNTNRDQVRGVISFLQKFPQETPRLRERLKETLDDLGQTEATRYHKGLRGLGGALGLAPDTPKRQAAPDCIWSLDKRAVAIFEAKTEKGASGFLSVDDVRQIITQPEAVKTQDGYDVPAGLRPIAVASVKLVAKEMHHECSKFLVADPARVHAFAEQWFDRLSMLHARVRLDSAEAEYLAEAALRQLRATPAQLADGLGARTASQVLKATK